METILACLGVTILTYLSLSLYFRGRLEKLKSEEAVLLERLTGKDRLITELKEELQIKSDKLDQESKQSSRLQSRVAELNAQVEAEKRQSEEKLRLLEATQEKITEKFKALSSEALKSNNQSFLDLARESLSKFQKEASGDLEKRQQAIDHMMKPVQESLDRVGSKLGEIEKARVGSYESLTQQVQNLFRVHKELRSETASLSRALRTPNVRGRWGEIQLKRVVEMAGMLEHCDFYQQESAESEEGRFRPDLLVRLPGEKSIVVDSKAALSAYLEAMECDDEEQRLEKLKDHARQIRTHMTQLSRKSYWEQFQPAPEFVVLFLPGEMFFSAALEQDPGLIEAGVEQRVIIATPTTLIALLRAVAYGWQQENLAANAKEISSLGKDLYKRLADMGGHLSRVGRSLGQAVESYNRAVGTLETRVMVSARKFKEMESAPAGLELEEITRLDHNPRSLEAPEMLSGSEGQSQDKLVPSQSSSPAPQLDV